MNNKNKRFKKKWDSIFPKNYLSFYYTDSVKAMANRRFRRDCIHNNIISWAIPSAFRIDSLFYAQGPCIGAVSAVDINYESYKVLNKTKSMAIFDKQRAFVSSLFDMVNITEKAQDFCFGLCLLFDEKNNGVIICHI